MNKRNINKSTFFSLLWERRPFSTLGILFTIIPFMMLLISSFATKFFVEPYQEYNFENITKYGTEKTAKITYIETKTNISINGKSPKIISYEYENNGKTISDKFQTLELDKISDLTKGNSIKIKTYNNQSQIINLEPFKFPTFFLYFLPIIFWIIGIPFLLFSLIPAMKNYNLYKNGIVREAEIISMEVYNNFVSKFGFNNYRSGPQKINIQYYFVGKNNRKIFGKSTTNDYSIINEKKSGEKIKIFVSENDENKSCIIPKFENLKYNWNLL